MLYGVLWTPISTLRDKKDLTSHIPLTLTTKDLNLADFNASRALALTGTFSPKVGYSDHFNAVATDKAFRVNYAQFHNRLFVAWDIETLAINGVERAYIASWVVSLGNKPLETGVCNHLLLDWKSEEGQLHLTKEIMSGIAVSIRKLAGGKLPKTVYIYAHNSGLFDLHVLLPYIIKIHNEESKLIPSLISDRENDIYQLSISYKGSRFLFRDRMKILPISLKSVGINILAGEVGKLSVNHETIRLVLNSTQMVKHLNKWDTITIGMTGSTTLYKDYTTPMAYIEAYCLQDSVVVVKALKKFSLELVDKGYVVPINKCITASSIGMNIWKSYFNSYEQPIMQIHINTKLQGELNKAYCGGRVEVFNSGLGLSPIYHFDVPGLYAGMMQKSLPIGNPVYITNFIDDSEVSWLQELESKGLIGFVKCQVQAPANLNIPVLPIKHNGKLTFPIGEFTGTWSTVELVKAIEMGYIIKPLEAWIFKAGTPLKSYSETLTNLKDLAGKEGNKTLRTVMKLLTNSLYGKFASKYFLTTTEFVKSDDVSVVNSLYKINSITKVDSDYIIVNHDVKPLLNSTIEDKDILNGAYDRASKALADKDLNIAIAATVTAYGRVQLYSLMQEVQERGGKVCYTDTDSVFAWMPESPINKPFGPYTWVGPAEEHTLSNSLFIAPKMYYHQDLSGKVTFKVKGVNTKNSDITYEQLCELFITKSSIKFTDQTQYRRVPKLQGVGVMITENLEKSYILQLDSKRTWQIESNRAWTSPFVLTISRQASTQAIKTLPECNYDIIVNTLKNSSQLTPMKPTTTTKITAGSITQEININNDNIIISIPIIELKDNFNIAWNHLLSTAAHNTNIFDNSNLNNIKWIQILVRDNNSKVWKTLAFFNKLDWIGYTNRDIFESVLMQIQNLNVEYDNAYTWTDLILKIDFEGKFEMVEFRSEIPIYKLQQDIKDAQKVYEQSLLLKQELDQIQDKLDSLNKYNETTKKLMDITLESYETIIKDFTTRITISLYNQFKTMDGLDEKSLQYIKVIYKLDDNITIDEARRIIANLVIESLKLVLRNIFKIEFHAWVNTYIKLSKLELSNEHHLRHTLSIIHLRIVILEDSGYLSTWSKGKVVMDGNNNFKTTPYIMQLSREWDNVTRAINTLGILTKIRFIPTVLKYNPDSQDQTLQSRDKVNQINTLNRVKVFIHPLYANFITSIEATTPDELKAIGVKLGFQGNLNKLNAHTVESQVITATMHIINNFIEAFDQKFYYNNFFADTRGRVYPELSQFRHIGSKWLRPLFCMEGSGVVLDTFPKIFKQKVQHIRLTQIVDVCKYWFITAELFKLDIIKYNTPQDFLNALKALETEVLNPQLKVRILEIEDILIKGYTELTSPFQIDMKNNAIQHAATIVGNTEAIQATGVLPQNTNIDDIYTKVAKSTIVEIQQDPTNPINEEIIKTLNPSDPNTIKIIRNIAKRPTMVIIYSATARTIGEYVYEALKDNNIKLSKEARQLLAKTIINKAFGFLSQEVSLMKELKKIISKEIPIISWEFGKLTDYVVKDTYFKIENKDIKLSHGNKQFHTSYNIITPKVDTISMKNALFVNIIHSLDALHLILTIKSLTNKNIFTIHDAYLLNWDYNKAELLNKLSEQFQLIHHDHLAIKSIVHRLSQTTGSTMGWNKLKQNLNMKPPILIKIGVLAA